MIWSKVIQKLELEIQEVSCFLCDLSLQVLSDLLLNISSQT